MRLGLLLFCLITSIGWSFQKQAPRVCVFYDRTTDAKYWMGRTYSIFLQNYLGHFPEFQQYVVPIEEYKKGQIDKCAASFYLGSYFENQIPKAFLEDFVNSERPAMWLGYSIWKLGDENLKKMFGYTYSNLTKLDLEKLDSKGQPGYFKYIHYKGEEFFKFGEWDADRKQYLAPFEMIALKPEGGQTRAQVISTAHHSVSQEELPYILKSKNNKYYVADIPFSFMHEADRCFIVADLLFDILQRPPRHKKRYALVRVEDIHPLSPLPFLYDVLDVLKEQKVPVHISLIPIFYDPLNRYDRLPDQEIVPMDRYRPFMQLVQELKSLNTQFIWHGITHQHSRIRNPHDGVSGSDFEFWDANNKTPLGVDSANYVLNRFEDGLYTLKKAGISPQAWLTPHYQASPLDYLIFGRIFPWNVGRIIYYNHHFKNVPPPPQNESDLYLLNPKSSLEARQEHFKSVETVFESDRWNGQIFPYEIYGDVYGQRLIPENLGNSQPFTSPHVIRPRTAKEMVADAKRNRVLRDVWASFFYHAFLLDTIGADGTGLFPGDPSELRYLLKEIKDLGYEFVSLDDFIKNNTLPKRPEPIYTPEEF